MILSQKTYFSRVHKISLFYSAFLKFLYHFAYFIHMYAMQKWYLLDLILFVRNALLLVLQPQSSTVHLWEQEWIHCMYTTYIVHWNWKAFWQKCLTWGFPCQNATFLRVTDNWMWKHRVYWKQKLFLYFIPVHVHKNNQKLNIFFQDKSRETY